MNRKNDLTKFNLFYPNASSKHVDDALLAATRDDYDIYVTYNCSFFALASNPCMNMCTFIVKKPKAITKRI